MDHSEHFLVDSFRHRAETGPVATVPTPNNKQDFTRTSLAPAPIPPRNSAKSLSDLHFRATNW
ncbi:MAG: hypothetical protein OXF98_13810, partial [Rhodospirillaceae bacterium]|nr:hypothetical protein [Rhodospirillaceae bacterium]